MPCPVCGTPAPPGARYCARCGTGLPQPAPGFPATPAPQVSWATPAPPPVPAAPRRRLWPWLAAAAVLLLLAGGGVTAWLLLRSPDPLQIAQDLEARRAEAWARQDVDLLRNYYADPVDAESEAQGFFDGAVVEVLSVRVVSADHDRIVAHVRSNEPGTGDGDPVPYEGDITYELVPVGGGEEDWRVTEVEVTGE
ncbi:zinc-ribbon domain-containing protein [Blastococcus sp. SYSU D00820]